MTMEELIMKARAADASDLHLTHDQPPAIRCLGQIRFWPELGEGVAETLIRSVLTEQELAALAAGKDVDFCLRTPDGCRQRVNIYRQQGHLCAAIRILRGSIPTIEDLGLPPVIRQLAAKPRGLVLVTGPTGSGKSTTLASMMQYINTTRAAHIVTIEDPIEYVYERGRALIHQREIGPDAGSFASALRSALREDPDVILVGEMRDYETISAALTAAETGHLVLSTLHTIGAASTVDRIINACPPASQQEVRTQLAGVLCGCITQQLLPLADGTGRTAVLEILLGTDAALNMIRENKVHQLGSVMQTNAREGMITLNQALALAVNSGKVDYAAAAERANDLEELNSFVKL